MKPFIENSHFIETQFECIGNSIFATDNSGDSSPDSGKFSGNLFDNCGFVYCDEFKIPSRPKDYVIKVGIMSGCHFKMGRAWGNHKGDRGFLWCRAAQNQNTVDFSLHSGWPNAPRVDVRSGNDEAIRFIGPGSGHMYGKDQINSRETSKQVNIGAYAGPEDRLQIGVAPITDGGIVPALKVHDIVSNADTNSASFQVSVFGSAPTSNLEFNWWIVK